jgi:hypothetical protein
MSISSPSTIRSTKTVETSRTELRAREEAWRQTAYAKDQECRQKEAEYNYQYDRMKTVNDEAEWNAAMGRAAAEQEAARADEEAARAAKLEEELRAMKEKEARRRARRDARRGGPRHDDETDGPRDDRSRSRERADADTIPEDDSSYLGTANGLDGLD